MIADIESEKDPTVVDFAAVNPEVDGSLWW